MARSNKSLKDGIKYLALALPLLNRIRGGLPILFGRELSTFWGKLIISLLFAAIVYPNWYFVTLTFAFSFYGLSLGHGSWFPKATDPDYDAFAFVARRLEGRFKRRTINFICMGLTGLTTTLGLSVTLIWMENYIEGIIAIVGGFSKPVAYEIGEAIPVGKKIWGAHQGIELAEWIWGAILAGVVYLIV